MITKSKYLSIGHCCHDKVGEGYVLGGTTSYASMLAHRLGAEPSILTSTGNDFLFDQRFKDHGLSVFNVPAAHTTVFENKYNGDHRTQTILARASTISNMDFQKLDQDFDIIHLSPIADEIDWSLLSQLGDSNLTLATPQGWLRQWDKEGKVSYKEMDWSLLSGVDFVVISEEDVPNLDDQIRDIIRAVDTLIVTKGAKGSVVYSNKVEADFPAYPSKIVDPTGAGDTFATGFILRYAQTKEIVDSMIFANCLASICIEHIGTSFYDHIEDIDQRMSIYKETLLNLNATAPVKIK